jgi:hypothetical protein
VSRTFREHKISEMTQISRMLEMSRCNVVKYRTSNDNNLKLDLKQYRELEVCLRSEDILQDNRLKKRI